MDSPSSPSRVSLPLVGGRVAPVAEPLGRVVADLLEARQKGQDHAASLDAVDRLDGRLHRFDRLCVQGSLAFAQQAGGR